MYDLWTLSFLALSRGRAIRASRFVLGLVPFLVWSCPFSTSLAAAGKLESFATANVGLETRLTSVFIPDSRQHIPVNQLIGIDLVYYMPTNSNSGATSAILSPNSAETVNLNPLANLLASDTALNSGIINLPVGSGIAEGESHGSMTLGLGITFVERMALSAMMFLFRHVLR